MQFRFAVQCQTRQGRPCVRVDMSWRKVGILNIMRELAHFWLTEQGVRRGNGARRMLEESMDEWMELKRSPWDVG